MNGPFSVAAQHPRHRGRFGEAVVVVEYAVDLRLDADATLAFFSLVRRGPHPQLRAWPLRQEARALRPTMIGRTQWRVPASCNNQQDATVVVVSPTCGASKILSRRGIEASP